jgi:hypothetical protein
MKLKTVLFAVVLLLLIPCMLAAQMPASPTPIVSIYPATPANLPLLDSATVQKFHPSAFILANDSDRAIVGLVFQWTYTDSGGNPNVHNSRSDNFMQVRNQAVILPHTRLLVGPSMFLAESLATKPHMGPPVETAPRQVPS